MSAYRACEMNEKRGVTMIIAPTDDVVDAVMGEKQINPSRHNHISAKRSAFLIVVIAEHKLECDGDCCWTHRRSIFSVRVTR